MKFIKMWVEKRPVFSSPLRGEDTGEGVECDSPSPWLSPARGEGA
jgi:hypothetical protein